MRNRTLRFCFIFLLTCVFAYPGILAYTAGNTPSKSSQVITNPKDPVPDKGKRKKIVFREELTIGVEEGDENYMFGGSIAVTVDESGCFFVMDWDEKRIQKYDPEGKYLCSIGRKGQGPGEFGNIWDMQFDSEGNIYATDIVNKRVSFFSKEDGQYRKQIRLNIGMGSLVLLPNGNYFTSKSVNSETDGVRRVDYDYGIFDQGLDLLVKLHEDFYQSPPMRGRGGNRAEFLAELMSNTAFRPYITHIVLADGRILIGHPDEYEIKEYDQDGALLRVIRKKGKARKVDSTHKDFYFDHQVMSFLAGFPGDMALKDDIRKKMEYPKYLPYYIRFQHMDNGWLFVIEDVLADKATIDLFDEKGVYVGRFKTDIPVLTMSFKNGKAYSVTVFDDYQFVKRYGYMIEEY